MIFTHTLAQAISKFTREMGSRFNFVFCLCVMGITTISAQTVQLNELMYRPTLSNGLNPNAGEYIELRGTPGANIGCYVLTDGDWTITIPSGTTLPADGIYSIGNNAVYGAGTFDLDAENCGCFTDGAAGLGLLLFTDGGEYVALFDGSGTFVDGLVFGAPTGVNTPPNGGLTTTSVINTVGLSTCPASVTIPGTSSFMTNAGGVAAGTSLVRIPDITGSWTSQTGGSLNEPNSNMVACGQNLLSVPRTFTATSGIPVDIDLGSTDYSNCTTVGNKANIQFTVSGVPSLSTTHSLVSVDLTFDANCGGNLRDIGLYIKSPAGTCLRIYDGSLMGTTYSGTINVSLRDGSCLNTPNLSNYPSSASSPLSITGNYGIFDANSTSDMWAAFAGENPNGVWTIYAAETTAFPPCITGASILFGGNSVGACTSNTDGDNCISAINWTGGPFCATTNGHSPSTQMPGSSGGAVFGNIGNVACSWNANNDNDTWISFTPQRTENICINISGLDQSLQSIIVTDANTDGDNNPCTGTAPTGGANDSRWSLVSCPRPSIYTTTAGTQNHQQHCFTGVAGTTYYLVVDGNGGAESPFFVSGFLPCPVTTPTITGDAVICSGVAETLSAGSYSQYLWSTGATTSTLSVNAAGTYSVTVTDANGCTGSASRTVIAGSAPTLIASATSPVCTGGFIQFNASGGHSYTWSGPEGYTASGSNPDRDQVTVSMSGNYQITATSSSGCTATATLAVVVNPCPEICGNGIDDDADGQIDGLDADCPCRN